MSDFYAVQPLQSIEPYEVTTLDNGKITVTAPSRGVISIQPDGTLQYRPLGTTGPYEQALLTPSGAVYQPRGDGTARYLVPGVFA